MTTGHQSELIRRLTKEWRPLLETVENTGPYSPEGKRARKKFHSYCREMELIAAESGNQLVVETIEKLILSAKGSLPSLDAGGSMN